MNTGLKHPLRRPLHTGGTTVKIRDRMNTGLKLWAVSRSWKRRTAVKIRDRMNTGLKHLQASQSLVGCRPEWKSETGWIRDWNRSPDRWTVVRLQRENQRPDEYGIETLSLIAVEGKLSMLWKSETGWIRDWNIDGDVGGIASGAAVKIRDRMNTGLKQFSLSICFRSIYPVKIRDRMNTGLKHFIVAQVPQIVKGVKIRDRMNTGLKHCFWRLLSEINLRENQRPDEYGIETSLLSAFPARPDTKWKSETGWIRDWNKKKKFGGIWKVVKIRDRMNTGLRVLGNLG